MGISSQLAAARLIQPGVCTSSTRPASPFEGQVIYETDTNQTLTYSGSAWVMVNDLDAPPGLQLIKTQTIGTAVSEVEVTSAFSSDFTDYVIQIAEMQTSASNVSLRFILGSTTTGYYFNGYYTNYAAATINGNNSNNSVGYFEIAFTEAANTKANYALTVHAPQLAQITRVSATWATTAYTGVMNGVLNNTTQYTSFKVNAVGGAGTGTMTGGTIRVYGYRNSI